MCFLFIWKSTEYGVVKASISIWCRKFSKECLEQALTNSTDTNDNELDRMKENCRLRAELEEARKENLFLKKQRHSLQKKSIRGLYQFILNGKRAIVEMYVEY